MERQRINVNSGTGEAGRVFQGDVRRSPSTSLRTDFFPAKKEMERNEAPQRSVPSQPSGKDNKITVRVLDKIIGFALFAIFFGVPLFFTGLTFQGVVFEKHLYFYSFLLLGLVAWTAKGVVMGEMNIRRTPLDIPILGFWLAAIFSTVFSIDRWHSFWGSFADPSRGFMNITAVIIAYYLISSNFNLSRLKLSLGAFISSGAILCVWTVLAILNIKFLPDSLATYAPISLSGSVMGVATIITSLIPLIAISIIKISESEKIGKIKKNSLIAALLGLLFLDLFLILALYNFIPWISLFIGVVIFLVFILSKIVRPNPSWTWLPMTIFVVIMVLRMIGSVQVAKVNFAEVKPLDYNTSWNIAFESVKDKAIIGSGPATYGYNFSLHRPEEFNNNIFYNLRFLQGTGVVLESVSTLGILGGFFLVVALLSFFGSELYMISKDKERNKLFSLGVFSSASILIVAAASTKLEGTVLILAAVLGALAVSTASFETDENGKNISLSLKASPKFALALAFVFMVVSAGVAFLFAFLGKIYIADVYAGMSSRTSVNEKESGAVRMAKAIRFYPKEAKYFTQLGQYYMIMANSEAMKNEEERDIQKIKSYLNLAISAASRGKDMNKNDVAAVEVLAQVYENAGLYVADSLKLSMENYQKALELEPHNPNFQVKLGQIKLAMAARQKDQNQKKNDIVEAKSFFLKAVEKKTNLAEGYYQLSVSEDALGNSDEAVKRAKKAVETSPKNTNYILNLARLYQGKGGEENLKNAEQLFKFAISQNDKNINAHFYLGILHEKAGRKQEAKDEYKKVASLLEGVKNEDTRKKLEKMIANVDAGIENTPQSLGLMQAAANESGSVAGAENQAVPNNTLAPAPEAVLDSAPVLPAPAGQ